MRFALGFILLFVAFGVIGIFFFSPNFRSSIEKITDFGSESEKSESDVFHYSIATTTGIWAPPGVSRLSVSFYELDPLTGIETKVATIPPGEPTPTIFFRFNKGLYFYATNVIEKLQPDGPEPFIFLEGKKEVFDLLPGKKSLFVLTGEVESHVGTQLRLEMYNSKGQKMGSVKLPESYSFRGTSLEVVDEQKGLIVVWVKDSTHQEREDTKLFVNVTNGTVSPTDEILSHRERRTVTGPELQNKTGTVFNEGGIVSFFDKETGVSRKLGTTHETGWPPRLSSGGNYIAISKEGKPIPGNPGAFFPSYEFIELRTGSVVGTKDFYPEVFGTPEFGNEGYGHTFYDFLTTMVPL